MELLARIPAVSLDTVRDEAPLIGLVLFFYIVVLRRRPPNPGRVVAGFVYVTIGLALFLIGLEKALFPLGKTMAAQLTDPAFLGLAEGATAHWLDYGWIYAFAAAIGFGTTIAEPSLLAVAEKAGAVSGGTIKPWGLRLAVALGVSVGVGLGAVRIVVGLPLHYLIMGRLRDRDRPDDLLFAQHHPARLRFRRRHDLDRHRAAGRRARPRPRCQRAGAQPSHRRLRAHRLRQRLPDHCRAWLRTALVGARGCREAPPQASARHGVRGQGMVDILVVLPSVGLDTVRDIVPLICLVLFFQIVVLRQRPANLGRIVVGFVYVVVGLVLFLIGLEEALFPLGKTMAAQLTDPTFLGLAAGATAHWLDYGWIYAFAAAIGFGTTIAEPSLMAVARKAGAVSGGSISPWGLRVAVAAGVAVGVGLGAVRIVTGVPLHYLFMAAYAIVILLTIFSSRSIIALAYDSGGVTSSTVTVPLVAALGLGLAANVPGRSTLLDGFGLIAFACVFAVIAVLGFAQLSSALEARRKRRLSGKGT